MSNNAPSLPSPDERSLAAFALGVVAAVAAFLLGAALLSPPERFGDGHEYALTLEAFASHLTPSIRVEDVARLRQLASTHAQTNFHDEHLRAIGAGIAKGTPAFGVFPTPSSGAYGYHFWSYPLAAVPARWALGIVGNPLKAFQLTNAIAIALTFAWLLLGLKASPSMRMLLALLYLCTGALWYWRWTHPEVFGASLFFVACAALATQRPVVAMYAAALAALQNPSMAALIPIVLAHRWACTRWDCAEGSPGVTKRMAVHALVALAICALPYLFYLSLYGKPSLIAGAGFLDASLIDLRRVLSFLFDLNQGAIVGLPGVLAALAVVMVFAARAWLRRASGTPEERRALLTVAALLATFVVVATPMLAQMNWNGGQSVYARYAFLSGTALVVAMAFGLDLLPMFPASVLAGAALAVQMMTALVFYPLTFSGAEFLYLKPVASAVMARAPWLVNPEPEIFYERIGHEESNDPVKRVRAVELRSPVLLVSESEFAKVLVRLPFDAAATGFGLCGQGAVLVFRASEKPVEESDVSPSRAPLGYVNGRTRCAHDGLPMELLLGAAHPLGAWSLAGFSHREQWGVWSDGPLASATARLLRNAAGPALLEVDAQSLVLGARDPVTVEILVNGIPVGQAVFTASSPVVMRFPVPANAMTAKREVKIEFQVRNPFTPQELLRAGYKDPRSLGIGLRSLKISAVR